MSSNNDLDHRRLLRESLGTDAQRERAARLRAKLAKVSEEQAEDDMTMTSGEEVRALLDRLPPDKRAATIARNLTAQEKAYLLDNGMQEPDPLTIDEVAHRIAAKTRADLEAGGAQGTQQRVIDRMQRTMSEDELTELVEWGNAEQARTRSAYLLASQAERTAKDFGIEDALGQQRVFERTMEGVPNAHLAEFSTDELTRMVIDGKIDLDDAREADARRRAERDGSAYRDPEPEPEPMTLAEVRRELAAQGREGFEADRDPDDAREAKPVSRMSAEEIADVLFDENGERKPEYQKPTK